MEEAEVFYLTSNSPLHPENSASDFKVSFNAPFDLTGQKIGLVDATVTKAESNVMNEKITFNFRPMEIKTYFKPFGMTARRLPPSTSRATFFSKYNGEVTSLDGTRLLKTTAEFSSTADTVKFTVANSGKDTAHMKFYSLPRRAKHGEKFWPLWILKTVEYPSQYSGKRQYFNTTGKTLKGGYLQHWPIPGGITLKFTFDLNQVAEFNLITGVAGIYEPLRTMNKLRFETRVTYQPDLGALKEFKPGPSHFATPNSLVMHCNKMPGFAALANLLWDKATSKVILTVKASTPPCIINFGGLERHLGFKETTFQHGNTMQGSAKLTSTLKSSRPSDMTGGTHHLFVYCSLGKQVGVNERMLQLVATLDATKGGYGQQVQHPVPHPLFVSCVGGPQQVVEVTIANDVGTCEGLLMGRTALTFEKRRERT